MTAAVYCVSAYFAQPLPADWRDRLATRLGARPRRLGRWAELGLYGALECLHPHTTLASNIALMVSSQHGPSHAMQEAKAQTRAGLPLPLTFLQIQPSQLLATLSAQLHWCGDARFLTHPEPLAVISAALRMAHTRAQGVLVGWVDEIPSETSHWLLIQPLRPGDSKPTHAWRSADQWAHTDRPSLLRQLQFLQQDSSGLAVIIKG